MLAYTVQKSTDRRQTVGRGGKANNRINADISTEGAMISILDSKKILNSEDRKYTDDEVRLIREYLYLIAKIQLNNYINDLEDDEEQ